MASLVNRLCRLNPKQTLFLLCDIQEVFRGVIYLYDGMVTNANKLIKAGKIFEIPLIVTEQYPEKLGNTLKEFDIEHAAGVFPKTRFSMFIPEVKSKIEDIYSAEKLKNVVLFGIETHVCIEQTSLDFIENKFNVFVVADCCGSRLVQDRDLALKRLRQLGCVITTSESVIFNILQDKNHAKFGEVRKLVSNPSADLGL